MYNIEATCYETTTLQVGSFSKSKQILSSQLVLIHNLILLKQLRNQHSVTKRKSTETIHTFRKTNTK